MRMRPSSKHRARDAMFKIKCTEQIDHNYLLLLRGEPSKKNRGY